MFKSWCRASARWFVLTALAIVVTIDYPLAADYPTRPVKLVVPYAAGGPTDILGRAVAEFLSKDLKQSVVVENKPGAQGSIGAEMVAHADADGYTLFVASGSIVMINPILYKKLNYDPIKDFRMLSLITQVPVIMEVNPKIPVKTVAEFVDYAKKNPGKINYGSSGIGSTLHLAAEMFKHEAGVEMTHVPYKGVAPALTDLLSGQLDVMFDTISTSLPHIQSGALRPLGVTTPERFADLPDVPTIAESGYPGYRVIVWYGISAPAKLPDDIAQTLTASLNRGLNDQAFRASLEKIGYVVYRPQGPEAITKFIDDDRDRWERIIREQKISID